jgi:hypothetical protein
MSGVAIQRETWSLIWVQWKLHLVQQMRSVFPAEFVLMPNVKTLNVKKTVSVALSVLDALALKVKSLINVEGDVATVYLMMIALAAQHALFSRRPQMKIIRQEDCASLRVTVKVAWSVLRAHSS